MIAIFGIFTFTLAIMTMLVRLFHSESNNSSNTMIFQTGITLFGFLIIIFLAAIIQLNKTSEKLADEERRNELTDKEVLASQKANDGTFILSV
ncbi:unnamed protein product [Schistosoma turkestanicum]|nr:unnamed protein product [Schistosoma turkestanicum]